MCQGSQCNVTACAILDVSLQVPSSLLCHSLSVLQAVVVAGICEFLGAVLLGSSVADTIKSGIAKLDAFDGTPGASLHPVHDTSRAPIRSV